MNALAMKVAPTALALAAGVYVVWPHLGPGGAAAGPSPASEAPEIPESLLWPKLPAPPARNPFDDPEEQRARAQSAIRKRLKDLLKRVAAARKTANDLAVPGRGPRGAGGADPLAGLALNATYTQGGKGGAVINGRVVQVGEEVRP